MEEITVAGGHSAGRYTNILFICGGTFSGLRPEARQKGDGFGADVPSDRLRTRRY